MTTIRRILGLQLLAGKALLALSVLLALSLSCGQRVSQTSTPAPTRTAAVAKPGAGIDATLDAIEQKVSALRGLERRGETKRRFLGSEDLAAAIGAQLDKEDSREQIAREQAIYRLLGLIDHDADLDRLYRELLGSQVLGLYDPETEEFLVLVNTSGGFGALAESTYAHEFAHRLQDIHYDLDRLYEATRGNSDQALALATLIEGDATLTQLGYGVRHMGRARLIELLSEAGAFPSPPPGTPFVMLRALEFPYQTGQVFAAALKGSSDSFGAIDQALLSPPTTSEQVIHVEKYRAREQAAAVNIPDVSSALGDGWARSFSDVLGEFLLRTWLNDLGASDAVRAAGGWGGDRIDVYSGPGGGALTARTSWDDPEKDSLEFFSALAGGLDASPRWKRALASSTTRIIWTGPGGALGVERDPTLGVVAIAAAPGVEQVDAVLHRIGGP